MADTLVEKKICETCGAEVRSGSTFCYNCGGAVKLDLSDSEQPEDGKNFGDARFQNISDENNVLKTTKLKSDHLKPIENPFEKSIEKPIAKPTVGELLGEIEEKPTEKSPIQDDAKLKSAANMRRKAKSFRRKTVEVVWEEPEAAPNKWFPLVAIILILFVAGIFYLAAYLK